MSSSKAAISSAWLETRLILLGADFGAMLVERMNASTTKNVKTNVLAFQLNQQLIAAGLIDDEKTRGEMAEMEAFLKKHNMATATTNFDGRAMFSVRPVRYFLFGTFRVFNNTIVWNVPITMKAGSNRIVLDQDNASQ